MESLHASYPHYQLPELIDFILSTALTHATPIVRILGTSQSQIWLNNVYQI
jgi:hypothetical protein